MAWTTLLEAFPLSSRWQFTPESDAELYRFSVVSGDFGVSGIGRYEVGQFDKDGSGYALKSYRTEPVGLIVPCRKPHFFESQRLGVRVPTGFNPFVLKVETNDMPLSSPSEGAPSSDSVTAVTIPSSVTAGVLIAANPNRKSMTIQNVGTATLFIDFDGNVSTTSYLTKLAANAYYEAPINFRGVVHGVWDKANGSAEIREYV
jgi:hypothetical protein